MNKEHEFQEYGESLAQSLLADSILLASARYQRLGRLDKPDMETVESGAEFLSDMFNVVSRGERTFATEHSRGLARAFEQAASAVPAQLRSRDDFERYVVKLRDVLQDMLGGKPLETPDFEMIDRFFTNYGARQFRRAQDFASNSV